MSVPSFEALYASDLQSLWALLVLPAAFLLRLASARPPGTAGAAPEHAGFVARWAIAFAVLAMVDPVATGPLSRALGLEGFAATAFLFVFVWLGDFRVFWHAFTLAAPPAAAPRVLARAAAASCVVPFAAAAIERGLQLAMGPLPSQTLWLVYELLFCALALGLRAAWVPRAVPAERAALRAHLRRVLAFVALYYALWASADVAILAGVDAGWALRMLPNQLYYGVLVPFAFASFFARTQPRVADAAAR